jgi:transcriptional regulator with XRE-family HTH domain
MRMTFNRRLKALREQREMTQEGLARAADLSVSTISKLEQHDMDPSWSTVVRLARALGVDTTAFETAVPVAGGEQRPIPTKPTKGPKRKGK